MLLKMLSISIHPMFLLIFNTSADVYLETHFNTSHVSINPNTGNLEWGLSMISIHPMFLLILSDMYPRDCMHHFNTSHVSINLPPTTTTIAVFVNFNTSHVSINL